MSKNQALKEMGDIQKKFAAKQGPETKLELYSYLLISKAKRLTITVAVFFATVVLANYIFFEMNQERHWLSIVFPTVLIGCSLLLIPLSEEWVYKPWQKVTQKIEHHFLD